MDGETAPAEPSSSPPLASTRSSATIPACSNERFILKWLHNPLIRQSRIGYGIFDMYGAAVPVCVRTTPIRSSANWESFPRAASSPHIRPQHYRLGSQGARLVLDRKNPSCSYGRPADQHWHALAGHLVLLPKKDRHRHPKCWRAHRYLRFRCDSMKIPAEKILPQPSQHALSFREPIYRLCELQHRIRQNFRRAPAHATRSPPR